MQNQGLSACSAQAESRYQQMQKQGRSRCRVTAGLIPVVHFHPRQAVVVCNALCHCLCFQKREPFLIKQLLYVCRTATHEHCLPPKHQSKDYVQYQVLLSEAETSDRMALSAAPGHSLLESPL